MVNPFTAFYNKYNQNPNIFNNAAIKRLAARYPAIALCNNILYVAPIAKWGLSVVPLTQAIKGSVPAEKVDIITACALTMTGLVWSSYAILLRANGNAGMLPLFLVNAALGGSNGWDVYRYFRHRASKSREEKPVQH